MKLYANRVVAILHAVVVVLTIIGFYIAALQHSLPQRWQPALALAVSVVGALGAGTVLAVKFLDGSQKSEALVAHAAMQRMERPMPTMTPNEARGEQNMAKTESSTSGQDAFNDGPDTEGVEEDTEGVEEDTEGVEEGPPTEETAIPDGHVDQAASDTWLHTRTSQVTDPEEEA